MLREVAEYPNSFVALSPGDERLETGRYTLCMASAAHANTVQRQSFAAEEIDEVLGEVRATLRERGRTRTQWEIGSAARPDGLAQALLARGLVADDEPFAIAVALRRAPPPPPAGLIARRVRTLDEYRAAHEVQWQAFGATAEEIEAYRPTLGQRWRSSPSVMHGVWAGGELICAGASVPTPHGLALFGGATLPHARGRGAYRALIAARWAEAEQAGAPALVTQAGAMSRPILQRLGFDQVGRIDMLVDEFGPAGR